MSSNDLRKIKAKYLNYDDPLGGVESAAESILDYAKHGESLKDIAEILEVKLLELEAYIYQSRMVASLCAIYKIPPNLVNMRMQKGMTLNKALTTPKTPAKMRARLASAVRWGDKDAFTRHSRVMKMRIRRAQNENPGIGVVTLAREAYQQPVISAKERGNRAITARWDQAEEKKSWCK